MTGGPAAAGAVMEYLSYAAVSLISAVVGAALYALVTRRSRTTACNVGNFLDPPTATCNSATEITVTLGAADDPGDCWNWTKTLIATWDGVNNEPPDSPPSGTEHTGPGPYTQAIAATDRKAKVWRVFEHVGPHSNPAVASFECSPSSSSVSRSSSSTYR